MKPVMSHGRKFFVTVLGMTMVFTLSIGVMATKQSPTVVDAAAYALSAMVLCFCGANSAVSWSANRSTGTTPAAPTPTAKHTPDD